jgi:sugar phosphate isomerase/epimerase
MAANANPMNVPIGLQLYSVGEISVRISPALLKQIASIGYKEVELAQTYGKSGAELRSAFSDNGLRCRSAHVFDFSKTPAQFMDFAAELGAEYVVASFNPLPSAAAALSGPKPDLTAFLKAREGMTNDDYKLSAQTCSALGDEAKKQGLTYAYHKHNLEFKKFDGLGAYDLLLQAADPSLVTMEMDCGWVSAAGHDSVAYLNKYPAASTTNHFSRKPRRRASNKTTSSKSRHGSD